MKHASGSGFLLIAAALLGGCNREPAAASTGPRVAITVGDRGFQPTEASVRAGHPVTVVFTRTSDNECGTQVIFPALNIRRDLPLNQPVEVTFTPTAGTITFTCGMNMLRGSIVAR
ncbi:MAG: cupredoxin domain-containing protein [Deltaproteobacteria bacterium]|jgi:plastocyanin domain-containing protein|nr:cupredoxin domain-containing protein [Deltaproteobacteria bacterium]MBK8697323.1 cupredoxin domain-containing protein [Deltaproteobacteria bacterium]MBP6830382.1 cupredoxin domain-containing protein [Deltaproteobacteria bacterium]